MAPLRAPASVRFWKPICWHSLLAEAISGMVRTTSVLAPMSRARSMQICINRCPSPWPRACGLTDSSRASGCVSVTVLSSSAGSVAPGWQNSTAPLMPWSLSATHHSISGLSLAASTDCIPRWNEARQSSMIASSYCP